MTDFSTKPHAVVDLEQLRDFIIEHSVSIPEWTGRTDDTRFVDAVVLADLTRFYERLTHRKFYNDRSMPHIVGVAGEYARSFACPTDCPHRADAAPEDGTATTPTHGGQATGEST